MLPCQLTDLGAPNRWQSSEDGGPLNNRALGSEIYCRFRVSTATRVLNALHHATTKTNAGCRIIGVRRFMTLKLKGLGGSPLTFCLLANEQYHNPTDNMGLVGFPTSQPTECPIFAVIVRLHCRPNLQVYASHKTFHSSLSLPYFMNNIINLCLSPYLNQEKNLVATIRAVK